MMTMIYYLPSVRLLNGGKYTQVNVNDGARFDDGNEWMDGFCIVCVNRDKSGGYLLFLLFVYGTVPCVRI